MPLRDNAAMRLTTALYYTPSGRSIQALGVSPDIVVEQPRPRGEDEEEKQDSGRNESDLRGSLNNNSLSDADLEQIEADREVAESSAELRDQDFQLAYAIDLLKGLRVFSLTE